MDPKRHARPPRPTTSDVVADLRGKIALQTIRPGTRLREEELAAAYGITRSQAREALAVLEDRGLVVRARNKGAVTAVVDMDATHRLYEVREVLDGLAVRLATANARPQQWLELDKMFEAVAKTQGRDLDGLVNAIHTFRTRVKEAAGNAVLTDILERIHDQTLVTIRRVAVLPGRSEKGIQQYRAVLRAMARGRADEAEAQIRELNRSAREFIERYKDYVV